MRKKVDKEQSLTPNPLLFSLSSLNEQRPLVLQGEGSDMFSNCILLAFYFQGILLPSPWRGVGGEALFPLSFLLFRVGGEALFSSFLFGIVV